MPSDGDGQRPQRRQVEHRAAGDLEAALGLDDLAEVLGVRFAEVGDDALADVVQLGAELVELLGGEGAVGVAHGVLLRIRGRRCSRPRGR